MAMDLPFIQHTAARRTVARSADGFTDLAAAPENPTMYEARKSARDPVHIRGMGMTSSVTCVVSAFRRKHDAAGITMYRTLVAEET